MIAYSNRSNRVGSGKLIMVRSDGAQPEVTLLDGLWSVRVGEAAELSARSGREVERAEI